MPMLLPREKPIQAFHRQWESGRSAAGAEADVYNRIDNKLPLFVADGESAKSRRPTKPSPTDSF
jgi:hypothetical protein